MCASHWVQNLKAQLTYHGGLPRKCPLWGRWATGFLVGAPHSRGVSFSLRVETHQERTRWYPKDGELCLARTKPGETLVEVRSDSDVQIDRLSWV